MIEKDKLTQIVKGVQKDKSNFEVLYTYVIDRVYFWCYTVIGNEADAKDAAQNAMICIYKSIQSLKNPEMFNSWMYRLVRNTCLNYIQKYKKKEYEFRQNEYDESYEVNIKDERRENIPHKAYDLKEIKRLIASFINNLPKIQREIIILYYLEEMKISEIAEVLGCSNGTIKGNLHRGRKKLETQVNEYQEKHHVKLYTVVIIPLMGLIINEYKNEICSKQDLHYNKTNFNSSGITTIGNIANILSMKLLTILLVATITIGIIGYSYGNKNDTNIELEDINNIDIVDIAMFNKVNVNPYIQNISYSTFPTKKSLNIIITFKKDVDKDKIKIICNNEIIAFNKNLKEVSMVITTNGKYTISIEGKKVSFDINHIYPSAPELMSVDYYEDYIKLNIDDELSQINYELSHVEYNGKHYDINRNLEVLGSFENEIVVNIYIDENCYRKYYIEI